jgi:hypothetical protein
MEMRRRTSGEKIEQGSKFLLNTKVEYHYRTKLLAFVTRNRQTLGGVSFFKWITLFVFGWILFKLRTRFDGSRKKINIFFWYRKDQVAAKFRNSCSEIRETFRGICIREDAVRSLVQIKIASRKFSATCTEIPVLPFPLSEVNLSNKPTSKIQNSGIHLLLHLLLHNSYQVCLGSYWELSKRFYFCLDPASNKFA